MTTPFQPYTISGADRDSDTLIICDHASNHVPAQINKGTLGLTDADMNRHIAFDIGAKGVSEHIGKLLNAPVICSTFSRLVIDPNRGEDDPTLMMRLYDGTIIPGNRHATQADIETRLNLCHRPYHTAVSKLITKRKNPLLISIHSFTPRLNGRSPRPWYVGVLSGTDRRLSDALLHELAQETDIHAGDNVPYKGELKGDCMDQHASQHGHNHTLIELRHDLIDTAQGQEKWAKRLAPMLQRAISKVTS